MTAPIEREFAVFRRGDLREDILRFFRNGLRALANPKTGQPFTEDEVRRATTAGSRFYIEADAIDLVAQGIQKRDEFLAQQMRIDRCGSEMLSNYHEPMWGQTRLGATGGAGHVLATGVPGTAWNGSTTVPDPFAAYATDPAGNRYQVLVSGTADGDGNATLLLLGIDTGDATNVDVDTVLTWGNAPPGSAPTATVTEDFTGGGPAETDADASDRLAARVRRKPGAGNESQVRDLARASSNAVEDAFVYPCALNAGSTLVSVTQKRGTSSGPLARLPNGAVLLGVTAAIVPPNSPTIPARAFFAVLAPVSVPVDLTVKLTQKKGSSSGWLDVSPFPPIQGDGTAVLLGTVTNQTHFRINLSGGAGLLPNGVSPVSGISLMIWDATASRFELLSAATITDTGGGQYDVVLATPPSHHLTAGDYLSPGMNQAQANLLAESVETGFDALGPGELVELSTSLLAHRAFRRPIPTEEWPTDIGQQLAQFIFEGLGASVTNAVIGFQSVSTPPVPSDPIDGPGLLTLGLFAVYPF